MSCGTSESTTVQPQPTLPPLEGECPELVKINEEESTTGAEKGEIRFALPGMLYKTWQMKVRRNDQYMMRFIL